MVAFGILALEQRGFRKFELAIMALLLIVLLGFGYDLVRVGPNAAQAARGFIPSLGGMHSVLLAVGISARR